MQLRKSFKVLLSFLLLTAFTDVSADSGFLPFYNDSSDCCYDSPCCDWTGFYLTGQLGGSWRKQHSRFRNANFFNSIGGVVLGNRFNFNSSAFIGGGGIGVNHQFCDNIVIGLEGGAWASHHNKRRNSPFFADDRYNSDLRWLGYAKARLGYAYNCFLVFVTGGWVGANPRLRLRDPGLDIVASSRKWVNGWSAGAGIDYKVWECFSVGVAYDYMQLIDRNRTFSCPSCGTIGVAPRVRSRHYVQSVVARLNYHFNLCNLW